MTTVTPNAKNKKEIKTAVSEDPQFRNSFLGHDLLFERITDNRQVVAGISPALFFEILLRRAAKEMRESVYTVERTISQRIPVFDTKETLAFLDEEGVFDYLVRMLVSFVAHQKQTATDINLENLLKLGENATEDQRFAIYKRIADVCLFILGIFPEYVMYDYYWLFFNKKIPIRGEITRTVGDYEMLGQEFYRLAAQQETAQANLLDQTLELFSKKFYVAKKPLNYLSEHFVVLARQPRL